MHESDLKDNISKW